MKILRKRYIPYEIVDISGDEVVFQNDKMIVTRWIPINPRTDFSKGISYILLEDCWKISKFFDDEDNLLFWYCDIIETDFDKINDTLLITDLLLDVKIFSDGSYEILDEDELEEAFEKNLITEEQKENAIQKLNKLIEIIKNGDFPPIKEII